MRLLMIFSLLMTLSTQAISYDYSSYQKKYKEVCGITPRVPIRVGFLVSPAIGACLNYFLPKIFRVIILDKEWLERASEAEIEATIFHEFGHCEADLDHNNTWENLKPESLMYPYSFSEYIYRVNREYYLKTTCPTKEPEKMFDFF